MADTTRVTLAEIAAEAGVSLATMSKVLNGRTDVSPATRARLEEHLARHGYQRRTSAQRSEFVELVFHELEPIWSMGQWISPHRLSGFDDLLWYAQVEGDGEDPCIYRCRNDYLPPNKNDTPVF